MLRGEKTANLHKNQEFYKITMENNVNLLTNRNICFIIKLM